MSRIVLFLAVALLALVPAQVTLAVGTAAGTSIANTATATFTVGTSEFTEDGVATPIVVDERLEVTVTWSDAGNVSVQPGDSDKPLKFTVTNTGNGAEAFTLTGVSTGISGDNFDPENVSLYLDDGNGTWDETTGETAFTNDTDSSEIAADGTLVVWVVNDIPGTATDNQTGISQLTAKASTITSTYDPGDVYAGAGTSGSDAVVGEANGGGNSNGGTGLSLGTYEVTSVTVTIVKTTSSVEDPWLGSQPVPGAVITYLITVDLTGSGTASSVVVTDPIPANTTYVPASIELNLDNSGGSWVAQSDGTGTDDSDYNITNPGEITVDLGTLVEGDTTRGIKFSVEID